MRERATRGRCTNVWPSPSLGTVLLTQENLGFPSGFPDRRRQDGENLAKPPPVSETRVGIVEAGWHSTTPAKPIAQRRPRLDNATQPATTGLLRTASPMTWLYPLPTLVGRGGVREKPRCCATDLDGGKGLQWNEWKDFRHARYMHGPTLIPFWGVRKRQCQELLISALPPESGPRHEGRPPFLRDFNYPKYFNCNCLRSRPLNGSAYGLPLSRNRARSCGCEHDIYLSRNF